MDDPSRLDRLREHLTGREIRLFPVSAVTGDGMGPLLEAMWREVSRHREHAPLET